MQGFRGSRFQDQVPFDALRLRGFFLGLIGVCTLAVGSISVMNIMLALVTERTPEIGLRKAIRVRPRHILVQCLLEALVLTFVGGLIGMRSPNF